jgi:hypothetical protein
MKDERMSDQEFDNYLALLSRLLKLGAKQRDAIAGELRSHLEDRLDELLARGMPRDEAVRQALEEFGDAAGLAAEFVSPRRDRRNRWIMRLTTASVAAIVLIAAGIFTFWPGTSAGPGAAAVVAQVPVGAPTATDALARRTLEQKLDQAVDVEFAESPFNEVIDFLQEKSGIQFVVKTKKLEEAGAAVDMPVNLNLKGVKLRTLLELLLEPLELTYMTKDDLILITTPEDAESPGRMIARVYDCRELLAMARPPGSTRPRAPTGGGGFFAVQDEPPTKQNPGPADGAASATSGAAASAADSSAGGGGIGIAGGTSEAPAPSEISDAENLINVITTVIDAEMWVDVGGPSAIAEYKGLLTVATTQETHQKVERLLNMLHQAAGLKEQRVKVVE